MSFLAVDGYEGWLIPENIDTSDWILALAMDGAPLGIGQQGPLWVVNARAAGEKPSDDHRGHWEWAWFYMRVGE